MTKKILIVEDEETILELLSATFGDLRIIKFSVPGMAKRRLGLHE